jgi:DNA-binding protein HU-beta
VNKAQLIDELSTRFEGNRKEAQRALEAVLDVVTRAVAKGEKVAITGFGAFEKVDRAARTARNPATGESVKVKKTSVPKFRPGAELKAIVSGAKKLPRVAASGAKSAASKATGTASKSTTGARASTAKRPTKSATAKKTSKTSRSASAKRPAKKA